MKTMTATIETSPAGPQSAVEVDAPSDRRDPLAVVCAAILVVTGALAAARLFRSPWVDEMTTLWESDGSLTEVLDRHVAFESNGPLYTVTMWIWGNVGGHNVTMLRIPSLIACALAVLVVFRLARELDGSRTAWVAATMLALNETIFFAATDARPYGLALLATTVANTEAIRWARTGKRRHGTFAALAAALALNLHLLTGFGLLALPYFLGTGLRHRTISAKEAGRATLVGALALTPLVPQLIINMSNATKYNAERPLEWSTQVSFLLTGSVLAAGLAALALGRVPRARPGLARWQVYGLALWMLAGVTVPFLVASYAEVDVFLPRYLVWTLPPASLLFAAGVTRLVRPVAAIAAVGVACALVLPLRVVQVDESYSWETAVSWVNASTDSTSTAVLIAPQHVMGKNREFFLDDDGEWIFEDAESLLWVNPLEAAHPLTADSYGLPYAATSWGQDYLDAVLANRVVGAETVVLIGSYGLEESHYAASFRSRLTAMGYVEQPTPDLEREVVMFTLG